MIVTGAAVAGVVYTCVAGALDVVADGAVYADAAGTEVGADVLAGVATI